MSRRSENEQEFRAQSYLRLIGFARPYWKRLTIGILAGLLMGGSLFVTLLMIPQMVGVVDVSHSPAAKKNARLHALLSDSRLSDAERIQNIRAALEQPKETDPKLTEMLQQAGSIAAKLHLPLRVEGRTVSVEWPKRFSFQAASADGRVAWQLFSLYAIGFVVVWFFKNLAHYVNGYCTRWVGARVVADLREKIFQSLMKQSLSFYGKMDIGHMISRCTNDTNALEFAVSHSIEDLTNAPLQVIACMAAVVVACRQHDNYLLLILLLCGIPLMLLPLQLLGRRIRKLYKKSFARIAEVISRMHEALVAIKVIKAYHTEKFECGRFQTENHRYFRQIVRAIRMHLLVAPVMEFSSVAISLVFLVASYRQGFTLTQLTALLAPAVMAYRPIKELSKVITSIQQSMAAADRFFALLDTDTSLPEKKNAVELRSFEKEISLEHVCFSYEDRPIVSDVTFRIPRGSMVAVVGETGSGKTTIANLIARFYDVTGGRITIDGVDVRDCSVASLRKLIGVVNQEPILFNDTIANNIAYGTVAAREEIVAAAKLANAHDFIVDGTHAEGYDTEVGENGFKLSGGEKQRVAIARAILKNPPILILDEATSALDNVTERLVQEALNRVMTNRTVFAIAHRLSTIQNADLILVLREGKIIESGTHAELLAKNGVYRKLHDTQFS